MMGQNRLTEAERRVRSHLAHHADDVFALAILGDLAGRAGLFRESASVFRKVLALKPDFTEAKSNLAKVLLQAGAIGEAIALMEEVVQAEPANLSAASRLFATLAQLARYEEAVSGYTALLDKHPDQSTLWLGYGNLMKTVGRADESARALRRALGVDVRLGDAWWAMANLKFTDFSEHEIETMQSLLASSPTPKLAWELHFTLGRVYEQSKDYARSFSHYAEGNRLRRAALNYDPDQVTAEVSRVIGDPAAMVAAPSHVPANAPIPIFIVGMPRAGSTLVEQILASHPMIEGTSELPVIPMLVQELIAERWPEPVLYPDVLAPIEPGRLRSLGESYLEKAALYRRTERPYFIDKQPNNWRNLSFILKTLPQAIIIDARRDATACCFSNFKQHFARGQHFAYSLEDMAHYYVDYVRLMAHFDARVPGRIHRVSHEALVTDPEREIRALLAHVGVPFDAGCLRFHENDRPVRTASSEQVRRPLSAAGLTNWQNYAPWLTGLRESLKAAGLA